MFTHFLLSGLRGAADRDGDRRVTLAEAYDFAYGRTLARSVSAAGAPQHPELLLALQGSGRLVVTELDPAHSRLALPAGADAHYFVYAKGSGAVLAEAWSRPDRPTTLALPAGRLVIQRQLAGANGITEVVLPTDGQVDLDASTFVPVAREKTAARGSTALAPWPNSIGVAGGATSDRNLDVGPALRAWYARESGPLLFQAGVGLGALAYETSYNAARSTRFEAILSAGRQWMGDRLTFHALGDLALRFEHQHLRDAWFTSWVSRQSSARPTPSARRTSPDG